MTETTRPASFGRVTEDGTVFVLTADGERMVGQIPDSTPEEALAFFERRFSALEVEVQLLTQRINNGALGPEEARKAIATLRSNITEANAVGDLAALEASLDALLPLVDEAQAKKREERAKAIEESRLRKLDMVDQAEKLALGTDWRNGVTRFRELLDEWKALPRLERASDDELWHRFSTARTTYTRRRKSHFAELGEVQDVARQAKEAIIAEAEQLADSTDWGATAGAFRALMERWKAAGSAQRSVDDDLWTRFRAIQDNFFNRRSEVFTTQDREFQANLSAKTELIEQAERDILPVTDVAQARAAYRDFLAKYNELGRVPRESMRAAEARVRAIEAAIDEADRREWARTDPQTRATAQGTVGLFSAKLDQLNRDLAKAEQAGDKRKADQINAQIASISTLLSQANQTLEEISR